MDECEQCIEYEKEIAELKERLKNIEHAAGDVEDAFNKLLAQLKF